MNLFFSLSFLFCIGSVSGWVIEVLFRRLISLSNPEHKWINPGFCTGPYLPLYGCGLCILFLIASLEKYQFFYNTYLNKAFLLLIMSICMTVIEYIAGILSLKITKVRLWDYSKEWGNLQGIVCPKFSLIWAILGAIYYFFLHPYFLKALHWFSQNPNFSFVIGLFFGIFLFDTARSFELVAKLKVFAEENHIVIRYETLKTHIRNWQETTKQKYHFFRPFRTDRPLSEHLKELRDSLEERIYKI